MTTGRPATAAAARGRTGRAGAGWRLVLLAPAGIALVVGMATGLGRWSVRATAHALRVGARLSRERRAVSAHAGWLPRYLLHGSTL